MGPALSMARSPALPLSGEVGCPLVMCAGWGDCVGPAEDIRVLRSVWPADDCGGSDADERVLSVLPAINCDNKASRFFALSASASSCGAEVVSVV